MGKKSETIPTASKKLRMKLVDFNTLHYHLWRWLQKEMFTNYRLLTQVRHSHSVLRPEVFSIHCRWLCLEPGDYEAPKSIKYLLVNSRVKWLYRNALQTLNNGDQIGVYICANQSCCVGNIILSLKILQKKKKKLMKYVMLFHIHFL